MTQVRDFNSKALTWDEEPRRVKLAGDVAEAIISKAHLTPDMDVMDFGCGTGLLTLHFQPLVESITGLDSSGGMLDVLTAKVRQIGITNVRISQCNLEAGDRIEGRFHMIVTSMTLHHVTDPTQLFRLFFSLLWPGGYLCLADLDKEDGTFHDDGVGVFHFGFERKAIRESLEGCGFKISSDEIVSIMRKVKDSDAKDYLVFLICAEKPL